jgi:hypothetical protein
MLQELQEAAQQYKKTYVTNRQRKKQTNAQADNKNNIEQNWPECRDKKPADRLQSPG